ncbi:hypothetical protein NIES267_71110 [Calothrix parasitica NIES-267]|uniref:Integral membrane protein n=1 Tax=Calothrix parasitica NIES-267 TaxID=1973488 RepID=A0A1Z4M296_9CYAN|nr:hypothetical protein NIES267_71110 [Calothrix parasitica NIES-267]
MLAELAIGITLAGLTVLVAQALPPEIHHKIYAVALILAASIYVGFSFSSQHNTWIFTETIGVIIFSVIAFLGVKFSPWFLAMGWLTHPAWDLFIDNHKLNIFVPHWYPTVCIGYDIMIALCIAWKCIKTKENSHFSH